MTPWEIDREVGDLRDDLLTPEPALTCLRYEVKLEEQELEQLGLGNLTSKVNSLRSMSAAENRDDLARIGDCAAKRDIDQRHFPAVFDPPA